MLGQTARQMPCGLTNKDNYSQTSPGAPWRHEVQLRVIGN